MRRLLHNKASILNRTSAVPARSFSSVPVLFKKLQSAAEVDDYLSKPTWSVESLLPPEEHADVRDVNEEGDVTSQQLHHLLRLSALPPPRTPEEEAKMLKDLRAQLHFVRAIQKVDTDNVEPLKSIRDESAAGQASNVISLETMKEALSQEKVIGKHYKRIRRRNDPKPYTAGVEDWDVLGQAPNKVGNYFVIKAERP